MTDTRPPRPDLAAAEREPGRLYWQAIAPIWDAIDIYGAPGAFLSQLAQVSPPQGLLLAAHWCQSEVCNGGLHQFFYNPTGILAPEAIRGFDLIEIPAAARVVEEAVAAFGQAYPREHARRQARLQALEGAGERRADWDPFFALDDRLYEATGQFDEQADAFVRAHLDMFFR